MSDPQVELVDVAARPTAVIRESTTWPELSATIQRLLDRVWAVMKAEPMRDALAEDEFGENVFLYLDSLPTLEIGVLTRGPIDAADGLVPSELPAGRVARTVHRGPYTRLGETHQALRQWCASRGHALTGVSWEHYGHWHEDPEQMETAVCYMLKDE